MNNKKTLIGLGIFALIAVILLLSQTSNFFGQGLVFTPGAEIEVQGPTEIYQEECYTNRVLTYTTPDEVPIHTICNAAEFEIGVQEDLTNVVVEIKKESNNEVVTRHRNFEPVMNAGQMDSTTWDGVSCGSADICEPGEYYIQATAKNEVDGHFPTSRFDFTIIGVNNCPIDTDISNEIMQVLASTPEEDSRTLTAINARVNGYLEDLQEIWPELSLPTLPLTLDEDTFVNQANQVALAINEGIAEIEDCGGYQIPYIPNLISPTDNAINVSITPTHTWEDVPTALEYGIVISESEDLSDPVLSKEDLTETSYTLTDDESLEYNTKYYWAIYAGNQGGSARSPHIFEFTTINNETTLSCSLTVDEGTSSNPFIPDEEIARFTYDSNTDLSEILFRMNIKNSAGNLIVSTGEAELKSWPQENPYIDWDGKDSTGNNIASATYTAEVYLATLNEDDSINEECTATTDIILQNRDEVEITVQDNTLVLGDPLKIDIDIPFDFKKAIVNVYDEDDDLIDTVGYWCAKDEECPVTTNDTYIAANDFELFYTGVKSNGEEIPPGVEINFKLWAKPVRGLSSSDYSEDVLITGGTTTLLDCEFSDVPPGHPDFNAVTYVCQKGLFEGYPDGTMALQESLTRAQLMTVGGRLGEQTGLCNEFRPYDQRIDGNVGYRDITPAITNSAENIWKLDALLFTTECGIIRGYGDGTVRLDQIMTHAEWWKIVLNAGKLFTSSENFDPWFKQYEEYLIANSIYPPNGQNRINRGDAIRFIYSLKNFLSI